MTTLQAQPFTGHDLRRVMAQVPTAVVVVAAMTETGPVGLTIGSFVSASLDPPLVGFLPAHTSTSWPQVEAAEQFAVSVLGEHAGETCRRFAQPGGDKFAGLEWHLSLLGSPVLNDAVAWFDCELEALHPAGDHSFVLARVHNLGVAEGRGPLVFYQGKFHRIGSPVPSTQSIQEV